MSKMTKDSVYEVLQDRIVHGKLPQGCRISEIGFAKELGVSRTPVREAFSRLVHEGIAEYIPNVGVFLKKPTRQDIQELYDLRIALEVQSIMMIGGAPTPQLLLTLELACQAHKKVLETFNDEQFDKELSKMDRKARNDLWQHGILEAEIPFHLSIVRATGNSRIIKLASNGQMLLRIYDLNLASVHERAQDVQAAEEHEEIFQFLKRKDPEGAARSMRNHLSNGRDKTLVMFDHTRQMEHTTLSEEMSWTQKLREGMDSQLNSEP